MCGCYCLSPCSSSARCLLLWTSSWRRWRASCRPASGTSSPASDPDRPDRTRIRPRSRPPSRQKQLNWNPECCVGLDWHTFVPRLPSSNQTEDDEGGGEAWNKKANQRNPELVLTLFDMFAFLGVFNHLKLFFCCTKRGDQLPSLKKVRRQKNTIKDFLCIAASQLLHATLIHTVFNRLTQIETRIQPTVIWSCRSFQVLFGCWNRKTQPGRFSLSVESFTYLLMCVFIHNLDISLHKQEKSFTCIHQVLLCEAEGSCDLNFVKNLTSVFETQRLHMKYIFAHFTTPRVQSVLWLACTAEGSEVR